MNRDDTYERGLMKWTTAPPKSTMGSRKRSSDDFFASCTGRGMSLCDALGHPGATSPKRFKTGDALRSWIGSPGGALPCSPSVLTIGLSECIDSISDPLLTADRAFDLLASVSGDTTNGSVTTPAFLTIYAFNALREVTPTLLQKSVFELEPVLSTLLNAMLRHPHNLTIQLEAARILQLVLTTRTPIEGSSEVFPCVSKALHVFFAGMIHHSSHVALQCAYMDLLRRFKHDGSDHKLWLAGTQALMRAVTSHPNVAYLQQIALSLIAWLAEDTTARKMLVKCVRILPQIMELHLHDALIQCNAAAALCWLIHAGDGRVLLESKTIGIVLDVMRLHQGNASAFGNCVCLLCGLTLEPHSEPVEVLKLVLEGMQRHVGSAKVQEGCLRWIRFRDPVMFVDELAKAIPVVLRTMNTHESDTHLQAQAAEVLAVWASVELLRDILLENGAVDIVINLLKRQNHDPRVQQGCVWFMTLTMPATPATAAFGGGFGVLESIWTSLGIGGQQANDGAQAGDDGSDDDMQEVINMENGDFGDNEF